LGTTGNLRTAGIGGKLNPEAQRSQKRESCVEYRALRTRTPFCLGLTVVQQINSISQWYLYEARHWHDAVMHHKLMLDNLAPEERVTVIALMREDEASEAKMTRGKP
jgi:hypothetical protein